MKMSLPLTETQKRTACIAELITWLEEMTRGGATEDVSPRTLITAWLALPYPALGNRPPDAFLVDDVGRRRVMALLRQMEAGAYG